MASSRLVLWGARPCHTLWMTMRVWWWHWVGCVAPPSLKWLIRTDRSDSGIASLVPCSLRFGFCGALFSLLFLYSTSPVWWLHLACCLLIPILFHSLPLSLDLYFFLHSFYVYIVVMSPGVPFQVERGCRASHSSRHEPRQVVNGTVTCQFRV